MSSDEPGASLPVTPAVPVQPRRGLTAEMWMLAIFSVLGLVGFIATFVLIMMRSPNATVQRPLTPVETQTLKGAPGERGIAGPPGPRGPAGPAGDAGVRLVRSDCTAATCTADCADDEVLLNAYCNPGRTAAAYPTEHSALCRAAGRGKVEVVAACIKAPRR